MCTKLKRALHFIIILIVCTGGWRCESTSKDRLLDQEGLQQTKHLPVLQRRPIKSFNKRTIINNMCQTKPQTHSNFHIFKFHVYLISYTRLFTKLNLFKILHLLQRKFPELQYLRSSHTQMMQLPLEPAVPLVYTSTMSNATNTTSTSNTTVTSTNVIIYCTCT